jgi:hypothetical protein
VFYGLKPYSSGHSSTAPPPAAALLQRQIADVPGPNLQIHHQQWNPSVLLQVLVAADAAKVATMMTAVTERR